MKKLLSTLSIIIPLAVMLCSCGSLPTKSTDAQASVPKQYTDTRLSKVFLPTVQDYDNKSGILLMRSGEQALRQRLYLADMAEHSIDAQYYIWNSEKR